MHEVRFCIENVFFLEDGRTVFIGRVEGEAGVLYFGVHRLGKLYFQDGLKLVLGVYLEFFHSPDDPSLIGVATWESVPFRREEILHENAFLMLDPKKVSSPKPGTPTVLLTRPAERLEPLKSKLERLGWTVLHQPTIEIRPPESWDEIDAAIRRLENDEFDWLVFSSRFGVEYFCGRIGTKMNAALQSVRLAAVGPGTAETLYRFTGRNADLVPRIYVAESLAAAMTEEARQGARFLLIRADRGRDVLRRKLEDQGGSVTEIAAYRSVDIAQPEAGVGHALSRREIDWIVVSSSAIAVSLVRFFGGKLKYAKLLSIGPIVTQTLSSQGFSPTAETVESSVESIVDFLSKNI